MAAYFKGMDGFSNDYVIERNYDMRHLLTVKKNTYVRWRIKDKKIIRESLALPLRYCDTMYTSDTQFSSGFKKPSTFFCTVYRNFLGKSFLPDRLPANTIPWWSFYHNFRADQKRHVAPKSAADCYVQLEKRFER